MSKIKFEYEGMSYTLEFNRLAVKHMERDGFRIDKLSEQPMTMLPQLFAGAFKVNHPWLKQNVIDEIYDNISDKEGLLSALVDMYNETVETLFKTKDEGAGKNLSWTKEG